MNFAHKVRILLNIGRGENLPKINRAVLTDQTSVSPAEIVTQMEMVETQWEQRQVLSHKVFLL